MIEAQLPCTRVEAFLLANVFFKLRSGAGKSPPKCILKKWVREDSLFENRLLWVVICGRWISIRFVCFCALTFVAFEPLNSVACF